VNYELSDHVREEIARRRIPLAVVESVLANPQQKVPEHGDVLCYQSRIDINQKEYLVRVMVNETLRPAKVVTVYRTGKSQKILEGDTMKVIYDPEVDVLRILFRNAPIEESDEDKPGVILDYDKKGNIVGLEVLNASERIENPRALDYAVTA
jgi:uncharacterized protein YuzE